MKDKIEILEKNKIEYVINKKKYKRLTVKYNKQGILSINIPNNMSMILVNNFISVHLDWIINHKPLHTGARENYQTGDKYLLFGRDLTINIINSKYEKVFHNDLEVIIYTTDPTKVKKLLEEYRYSLATDIFNELLYKCFSNMTAYLKTYPSLIIKKSVSKWGCCYYNKNKIMLNVSLVNVPLNLLEYVIYHELCHFIVPNHSKEFHEMLSMFVKDEKYYRKLLKCYTCSYS